MNNNESTVISLPNSSYGIVGVNEKFLGKRIIDNRIGVVKFPLSVDSLDCVNEAVCYHLGLLFGFDVAEASLELYKGRTCVISCYSNNFIFEYNDIKTLKSILGTANFHSKFKMDWIFSNFGKMGQIKFIQMVLFDTITNQRDRHINNIAFSNDNLYSLYDNGRSLFFYEPHYQEYKRKLLSNKFFSFSDTFYTNEHGYGWLWLEDSIGYDEYKNYINLNVSFDDILTIFNYFYKDKERAYLTAIYVYRVYMYFIRKSGISLEELLYYYKLNF